MCATVVQLVVRHLAKVEVAGSSPVCRSYCQPLNSRCKQPLFGGFF